VEFGLCVEQRESSVADMLGKADCDDDDDDGSCF
jgi:hypothetical protein